MGEDWTVFFNPDEEGITGAAFRPGEPEERTVYGEFRQFHHDPNFDAPLGAGGLRTLFVCPHEFATDMQRGAALRIDETTYTVHSAQPDGTGVVVLELKTA